MNWTRYFKEIADKYAGDDWAVYDNADPTRVWSGRNTIEFARRGVEITPYLSGDYSRRTELSIFTRAGAEQAADEAAQAVFKRVVETTLDALVKAETISGYTVDRSGVFADERGTSIGESFSGFVDFTIFEEIINYG